MKSNYLGVLFTEQDSMDFEPAPFLAVQNEEVGVEHVMEGRKYGFNIKSQLLKLFVIFPAVSALAAWVLTVS